MFAEGVPSAKPHTLRALINDGDWACAHQQPAALVEVTRLLGPCLASPQQIELDEIARIASSDMGTATRRWSQLCNHLRTRLFEDPTP